MAPDEIKKDIYSVMTSSRELANYCQESVKSFHSKKISNALNNFHLKTSIDFVTNLLTDHPGLISESNEVDFDDPFESVNKPIFIKVIDYIETYLMESNI